MKGCLLIGSLIVILASMIVILCLNANIMGWREGFHDGQCIWMPADLKRLEGCK